MTEIAPFVFHHSPSQAWANTTIIALPEWTIAFPVTQLSRSVWPLRLEMLFKSLHCILKENYVGWDTTFHSVNVMMLFRCILLDSLVAYAVWSCDLVIIFFLVGLVVVFIKKHRSVCCGLYTVTNVLHKLFLSWKNNENVTLNDPSQEKSTNLCCV